MNKQVMGFMEFKALGNNYCDYGFSLTGRKHTAGAVICLKIEQELRNGTLDIDVQGNAIYFIFEGIKIGFTESPERLLKIEQILKPERHLRFEPYADACFEGFALRVAD